MRLLIAEDDRALGMFLRRGLEADGHQVTLVGDGHLVVDLFIDELPDLTILDLNLPRRDGVEALRLLRAANDELPILILTARSDVETKIPVPRSGRGRLHAEAILPAGITCPLSSADAAQA